MPRYLLSGKRPDGRRTCGFLEAASGTAAVKAFRKRDCTDIVLHTDEAAALELEQMPVSPRDFLALRDASTEWRRALVHARISWRQLWVVNLAFVAFLVWRRLAGRPWGLSDWLALLAVGVPLASALVSVCPWLSRARRHDRLMDALAWGRWEEALELLPRLRGTVPPLEYAFREAQALAGLGRLDEALGGVADLADNNTVPEWLCWGRLAEVYGAAGSPDDVLDCKEKAVKAAPQNPTALLDLVSSLLRRGGHVRRAESMLARAKSKALSDTLVPYADAAEGILALERDEPEEAKRLLTQALTGLSAFRLTTPLIGSVEASFRAWLAVACARLGDMDTARREFGLVEPRLRALKEDDLIRRCEQALADQL